MSDNAPKMVAYAVREREGGKDVFTRIGAVFSHNSGEGFTLLMDALPLGRKVVVLPAKEDKDN